MVRIAYFGTDGCPGHHVIPIRGKFTEEDIKVIESVDCDDFYKVFDVMRFKIAEFKGWTILGIPASLDDHRPGSKTVIFIEGEANEADFIEVTQEYSFLKNKVKKLAELYHDGEWLATGKLNQDPPTNKERFQFTLDKDDVINMIRGVDLDPYSDVANEMEKIGLGSSWDLFDVPERETAFEYDGHTPNEASDRLEKYLKLPRHGMTFEQALERLKLGRKIKRIDWGKKYICMFDVNILMIDTGQKVASNWNPTEHDIMSNDWEIAG